MILPCTSFPHSPLSYPLSQAKLSRLAGRPPDVDVLVGLVRAEAGLASLPAKPLDGPLHLDENTGMCAQVCVLAVYSSSISH